VAIENVFFSTIKMKLPCQMLLPVLLSQAQKTCLFSSLHLVSTTRIIIVISGIHGEATGKHDHLSKDGNKKKKMRAPPTVKKSDRFFFIRIRFKLFSSS
jgi:hypothetical protein